MTLPQSRTPGRSCPVDYRYGARALAAPATLHTDSLWIAGGLYGNAFALHRLEELFAAERGEAKLVFNGDFHWFDVADEMFVRIERGVARYCATRGNVESEIAHPQEGAGCGCGYPDWVDEKEVARSNRIIERLKQTAGRISGASARLDALPLYRLAEVGGQRVAIVHGDADSLAGWAFSQEMLATEEGRASAAAEFQAARVDVFASSHSCLPVLQSFEGVGAIANNGAAGMPNFSGSGYGLASRIALTPHPDALYRAHVGALHVEAIPIDYDTAAWHEAFLAQWPEGSDAHASYWPRIRQGPKYETAQALRSTRAR